MFESFEAWLYGTKTGYVIGLVVSLILSLAIVVGGIALFEHALGVK